MKAVKLLEDIDITISVLEDGSLEIWNDDWDEYCRIYVDKDKFEELYNNLKEYFKNNDF